ncbi:MAG: PQQ-binding-like beta-propeller repeat protein [Candidatus Saliniplasma sp.]
MESEKSKIETILVLILLFLAVVIVAGAIKPRDRDTIGKDFRNEGFDTSLAMEIDGESPLNETPLWTYEIKETEFDDRYSSPFIGPYGNIYVLNIYYNSSAIYSIDRDGNLRWNFTFEDETVTYPTFGDDGTIYFVSVERRTATGPNISYLYALDNDGELKWKNHLGDFRANPRIAVFEDSIYISIETGELHVYDTEGNFIFDKDLADGISYPIVGGEGTVYLLSSREESEVLIAIEDSDVIWERTLDMDDDLRFVDIIVKEDSDIYLVFSEAGEDFGTVIYSYTPQGELEFIKEFGFVIMGHHPIDIGRDGTLYFISLRMEGFGFDETRYHLKSLNSDGDLRWEYDLGRGTTKTPWSIVYGDDGMLYVGFYDNTYKNDGYIGFHSFDDSGEIRWEHSFEDAAFSDRLIVDEHGTLYLTSTDGVLYAYGEEESENGNSQTDGFFSNFSIIVLILFVIVILAISLIYLVNSRGKDKYPR